LHIFWANVATNWSDADGDPVTVAGINMVTTNGVNLLTNNTQILYPASGPAANDQINYIITDGMGGTGTGKINLMSTNPFVVGTQGPSSVTVHDGTITVVFFGIPSYVYEVQRATNLSIGPGWTTISTYTVGTNGLINVTDAFQDLGGNIPVAAFYRLGFLP
jgi:hypothetical protein